MRLAIVDLDGVIADSSARNTTAHRIALEKLSQSYEYVLPDDPVRLKAMKEYKAAFYADDAFYDPDFIALDTAIEGAIDTLATLAFSGHYVMLLTSRPESLRQATRQWLFAHDCPLDVPILMKPSAYQYVKTAVWKAGTVQMLVALYGASDVLFVDDEDINRSTLMDAWMAQGKSRALIVASSLKDALEKVREDA